jgi:hypothetical protein
MSADGLARFDTRTRNRTAQTDEYSHQTDLRTLGARERGQLALDELENETGPEGRTTAEERLNDSAQTTEELTRADLKAALGCARATIDGLREQVAQLEAEREQLHAEIETGSEADR